MPADAKLIEELKAKHGEIHELTLEDATVIVKVPSEVEWKRFMGQQGEKEKRVESMRGLFWSCAVWPDKAAVESMVAHRPGLVESFAGEICEIAGLSGAVTRKKL